MRKAAKACLAAVLVALACGPARAWGPGGHGVIMAGTAQARGVRFPSRYLCLQAIYGATAPDFAWGAPEPLHTELGAATHDEPGYAEPWDNAQSGSVAQRAFAWGWLTHNQAWGADYYAHLGNPFLGTWPAAGPGYVVERAVALAAASGVDEAAAHSYVEAAIDLLLDQQHPELRVSSLLGKAAARRDAQVPGLLVRSYADVPGAGWLTIRTLESAFRAASVVYAEALALPTGEDDLSFAAAMAPVYGLPLEDSIACLAEAKAICQEPGAHYEAAIEATIALVAGGPLP